MRDFRDAKAMAQTLRDALKAKSVTLTHSESLELIARTLGLHDWNELAARIQFEPQPPAPALAPLTHPINLPPLRAGQIVPMLPLRDIVFFPHMAAPLFLGRDKSRRALEHALASDGRLLVVTQRRSGDDDPGPDALYHAGVAVSVIQHLVMGDGSVKLLVQGLERAAVARFIEGQFWSAEVAPIEEPRGGTPEAAELAHAALQAYQAHANIDLSSPPQALMQLKHPFNNPGTLADTLAQLLSIRIDRAQELLETGDVVARLEKILELMKAGVALRSALIPPPPAQP
jgi:ATP-dependent Lon protease